MTSEDSKEEIKQSMQRLLDMNPELAKDCIEYITTQLNKDTLLGEINSWEYTSLVQNAVKGANKIIYFKHYSRDLVSKKAFSIATTNLIILLYTRILYGNDRRLLIEEFKSKQPIMVKG